MSKKPAKRATPRKPARARRAAPAKPARKSGGRRSPAAPPPGKARKSLRRSHSGASRGKKSSAQARSRATIEHALAMLRYARRAVNEMASGIPDERAAEQLPGAANHMLWTLGHLAVSCNWFASLLDGDPPASPPGYDASFGIGSTPVSDVRAYPPIAEVRAAQDAAFERLLRAIERLDDGAVGAPLRGDAHGFASDTLDLILKAAWHEGWHVGQLAALRRGLGLARPSGA